MKLLIGVIILLILTNVPVYPQEKILVSLSPQIGVEINRDERDTYNLFPDVPNFISARFYKLPDNTYEIEIKFFQNGVVKKQSRIITPEAFQRDYQDQFSPNEYSEYLGDHVKRKQRGAIDNNRRPAVNLGLDNAKIENVKITNIEKDSIITERSVHKADGLYITEKKFAIADITYISQIRKTNVLGIMGIGIIPGILASFVHSTIFVAGDDARRDKIARVTFYSGEIVGVSIAGTIAAMKSIDHDYIFSDLTPEQKKGRINEFLTMGLPKTGKVTFSPWAGLYNFSNYIDNTIFIPGMRLAICFSPRHSLEFMFGYGNQSWSGDDITISYYGRPRKFTSFYLFKTGFRMDYSTQQFLNPFIAWGWGLSWKKYKTLEGYNEYRRYENDINTDLIATMEIGITHHFNRWAAAEARFGVVENIDYGLHTMWQFGIQLGNYY